MRPIFTAMLISVLVIVVGCFAQMQQPLANPGDPPLDPAVKRQQDAIKAIKVRGGNVELDGAQTIAPDTTATPTDTRINPRTGLPMTPAKPPLATDTPVAPTPSDTPNILRPVVKVDMHGFRNVGAAMATIEPLTKLHNLNIYNTRPTAADLQRIGMLQELRLLDVIDCGIKDDQLGYFRGLKNLSELDLDQNPITDAGLAQLQGLTNLHVLTLLDTQVTDQGLAQLRGLKNLDRLAIGGKGITDQGLAQLEVLANLRELYLPRTAVTPAGIAHLQAALPRLHIIKK
jgi:hypothetical protein